MLVTRLSYLGDVLLTLPLVENILKRFPLAEVDYLCRPPASDLLSADARFAQVFNLEPGQGLGESINLVRRLRSRRYRVAVDLYSNPRSAWLTFLCGAGLRVGGNRRGRRYLYTHNVTVPSHVRSAVEHHLQYLLPLGITAAPSKPVYDPAPGDVDEARSLLVSKGIERSRSEGGPLLVGIHPGGKWEVKRWPARHFASLIERVEKTSGANVVVLTGPGESGATDELLAECGADVVKLPVLPIRKTAGLLAHLDAMVVGDGGIMHLAVAVGTPTVGIFGSSEPDIWFPYEPFGPFESASIEMECRPCHRHVCPLGHTNCLNQLSVDAVLEKLHRVLEKGRTLKRPLNQP